VWLVVTKLEENIRREEVEKRCVWLSGFVESIIDVCVS